MKRNFIKKLWGLSLAIALAAFTLAGCGEKPTSEVPPSSQPILSTNGSSSAATSSQSTTPNQGQSVATEIYVQFGDDGEPFTMHLYDNETATAIANHVGAADWRIPLYNYEGYENYEVMQYYDIPSRYEIPSSPEAVTSQKAGEVYYSQPNRIVLFYGDAQVSAEYTPVGYFDATEEFKNAVTNNPVLEGWSNKIIHIKAEQ